MKKLHPLVLLEKLATYLFANNRIERLSLLFWLLMIAFLINMIFSCSAPKRLARLEKNHSYLFNRTSDTITINDTISVTIPGAKSDTFFQAQQLIDTVYYAQNGITTTLYLQNDTIYVQNKTDTIYKQIPYFKQVPYVKNVSVIPPKTVTHNWKGVILMFAVFLLIFLVFYFVGRFIVKYIKPS